MPKNNLGKYAYYAYTNPTTGKVVTGDMNWWEWERLQKDAHRAKHYTLERAVDFNSQASVPQAVGGTSQQVIVEEDPLECPICGKVCKNELGLNSHKRSHEKKQSVPSED